jgi:hypothetical protein
MNIILLEYRKGWNRNKEEKGERVKIWWNEKIYGQKTDNCPYIIYLQIKYMVGNQNYIVTNNSNKTARCIGALRITWLCTEYLVTAGLVKSPVQVGYQNYCGLPMFTFQSNTAIPMESNLNGEQLVLVTWRGYKMQSACPSSHTYTQVRVISPRAVEIILPSYLGPECPITKVFGYSLQRRNCSTESRGCLSQVATHLHISIYFWSAFMSSKTFILCQSLTENYAILQYAVTVTLVLEYFPDFIGKSRLIIASLCPIMFLLKSIDYSHLTCYIYKTTWRRGYIWLLLSPLINPIALNKYYYYYY